MDYTIEINVWNLGFDEADELVDAICSALDERGLGAGDSEEVRSIVALKPRGMVALDSSTRDKSFRVLGRLTRGARLIAIPGTEFRKVRS